MSELNTQITRMGMSCKVDASGAQIGRRYARMDEIGVPFSVVVEFNTGKCKIQKSEGERRNRVYGKHL